MKHKTPSRSSTLLILQMLQMHYEDEYYKMIQEIFNDENEKRILPEEYWLISHGLMSEDCKFSNAEKILKTHRKEFSSWFLQVLDIMFPVEYLGESSSDK